MEEELGNLLDYLSQSTNLVVLHSISLELHDQSALVLPLVKIKYVEVEFVASEGNNCAITADSLLHQLWPHQSSTVLSLRLLPFSQTNYFHYPVPLPDVHVCFRFPKYSIVLFAFPST